MCRLWHRNRLPKRRISIITADDAYRDKSTENDEPKAGDNIVLCGHNSLWDVANGIDPTLNRNRMNVTMITTSKEEGGHY